MTIALLIAATSGTFADTVFYPARPTGALRHIQGVLTKYGHGNELGTFTIVDSSRVNHTFYVGKNMMIEGVRVYCGRAPTSTYTPGTTIVCPDWPKNIMIGRSIVNVVFWSTTYQGLSVEASDSITLVSP